MKTDLERLIGGLMAVQERKNVDISTAEQLVLLRLIERTQDASYVLTTKGEETVRTENLGAQYPGIDQIRMKVEALIQSNYNDDSISEALGVDNYKTLGRNGNMSTIGRYLGRIHPDDVIPTASVLGDSIRVLATVVEGLADKKNNKLFVRGAGLDQQQSAGYIKYGVKNYGDILSGEGSEHPPVFIDLSFIGNIPFSKFIDHEDLDQAIYYTVRYITSGKTHSILDSRLHSRRMSLSRPTLKSAIDAEVGAAKFNRNILEGVENPIILSEPIKGGIEWNRAFIREYERNHANSAYRYPEEEDFMQFVAETPCLFIHETGSSELRTSREITLDFAGLPSQGALKIFGATENDIVSTNLRAFVARSVSVAKLRPVGGGSFKPSQLEDLSSHLEGEEERIMFMLGYMLEKCDGIDGDQLQLLLSILIDFSVTELSKKLISQIRRRTRLSDELIEKYKIRVAEYAPKRYMSDFPKGVGELISDDRTFFNSGIDSIGLVGEIDSILDSLEQGEPVVYIDETGYKDPNGENGDYVGISERIRTGLVQRIMSGDIPDAVRNHSVVLIENSEDNNSDIFALFFGLVAQGEPINLSIIREELRKFIRYNPRTIIILSLNLDDFDAGGIGELIRLIQSMGIKLVIEGKKDIPGTGKSVRTMPFTEDDLSDRILDEIDELRFQLGMEMDARVCRKLVTTISRYRKDGDDPLWMAHEVLKIAKNNALGRRSGAISGEDASAGLSYVLGVASVESMRENRAMIARLPTILKKRIVGQDTVIDDFCREFMTHMTGGGNPERPLSYLFPGPTGVGKTLFGEITSRNFNLPFLAIDGSQYTEEHHGERLTGSPPGYKDSGKPGILTGFMKDNPRRAFVFVDEIDKMHPTTRMRLMNFFDEGKMTDGHGMVYRRPQYTIVVATNAGAEKLKHGMSPREVLDCIGEAFKDEKGTPKPELASRFRISPMLPVDESSFKRAIRDNLHEIELRASMVAHNIEIAEVGDEVVEFVFNKIKNLCQKFDGSSKGIGFTQQQAKSDGYFNLREIVRCIDANIEGDSLPTKSGEYRVVLIDGRINLSPFKNVERD